MDTIAKLIDQLNEGIGKLNAMLILPLVAVVFYEVIMRYAFNSPTVWGFEMTVFIYGVHFMLGLAITENRSGHVQVDVLVNAFPKKVRAAIGILTSLVIFLPVWSCMAYYAVDFAATSTSHLEVNSTSWAPAIWPYKVLMALGFVLLFLQGISTLIKHIQNFRGLGE